MSERLTAAEVLTELRCHACGLDDEHDDTPFLRGYVDATREAIDLIEANLLPPADDEDPLSDEDDRLSMMMDDDGQVWVTWLEGFGNVRIPCHIRTRGDLRRLWMVLTGKELQCD